MARNWNGSQGKENNEMALGMPTSYIRHVSRAKTGGNPIMTKEKRKRLYSPELLQVPFSYIML